MKRYIYRMTSGPMDEMQFHFNADSREDADMKAELEAARLQGKFKFVREI